MDVLGISTRSSSIESSMKSPTVHQLTEHLFRHEAGRIVSILTGIYGARYLQLAEDVVQEAMIRAMKSWPVGGIPENPNAWLLRAAKNLAIDQLRREKSFLEKESAIITEIETSQPDRAPDEEESEVADDQLRLIFVCCHPALPAEAQSALALKTLCGFSPAEIASAFLISEAAVSKRLVRARQRIRDERIPFEIPAAHELPQRLDGVLKILYLLFNEGHRASQGDTIIRADLCHEAIRLAMFLAAHPAGDQPHTHALIAMMAFTAARLPARTDSEGNLLRLDEQDRSLWNRELIALGLRHLGKSSSGNDLGEYHLQAGIAACHTLAPSDAATDWPRILSLYDQLLERNPSPVIALNRTVAISKVHGPEAAICLLETPEIRDRLENYHLLHAVLGELEFKRHQLTAAADHFRRAIDLTEIAPERALLAKRLEECLG
jgi:RNA polymerase sigma-70 factor (ECF subfamily)